MIEFVVYGRPQQRGSKFSPRDSVQIIDQNKRSGPWMENVALAARAAYRGELITDPIELSLAFYFERPKSHFGSGKNAAILKKSAQKYHAQKPDLAKLIRAAEDAMTNVIWRDDAQVYRYCDCHRAWTLGKERMAVKIRVLSGANSLH